jgi:hypothetical protein
VFGFGHRWPPRYRLGDLVPLELSIPEPEHSFVLDFKISRCRHVSRPGGRTCPGMIPLLRAGIAARADHWRSRSIAAAHEHSRAGQAALSRVLPLVSPSASSAPSLASVKPTLIYFVPRQCVLLQPPRPHGSTSERAMATKTSPGSPSPPRSPRNGAAKGGHPTRKLLATARADSTTSSRRAAGPRARRTAGRARPRPRRNHSS